MMFVKDISGENVFFDSFSLKKGCSRHGECRFDAFVDDALARDCIDRVGSALYVASDEDPSLPLFCGVVTSAGLEKNLGATRISIVGKSLSLALDKEPRNRIFQNPEKTFGEILESIDLSPCLLRMDDIFKNALCQQVVLQQNETDFGFLLRLAKAAGTRVWINDQREDDPVIIMGQTLSGTVAELSEDKIIRLRECRSENGWRAMLESLEHFEPGQLIRPGADGREYLVLGYDLARVRGMDLFTYDLVENRNPEAEKLPDQTAILKARVQDAQDPENLGRVRVAFEELEDGCEDGKRLWLPFRPAWAGKASGTVFVPDPGDLLETVFVNGDLYASATLRDNPLLEECRKVTDKCIGNNSGQRIFWKEKSLDLLSSENFIHVDEDKIELVVGENQISITRDGIQLKTPDAQVELSKQGLTLNASGALVAKSDGNWQARSGAILEMEASSSAALKGSSVDVKANGGKVKIGARVELGY